jgi:glutaminase
METGSEAGEGGDVFFVSTGHLPSPEQVRRSVQEAYERYRTVAEGENSTVYPALARVPAGLFGICAVGTSGSVAAAGDAEVGFTIMSVAKPFVFALLCQALGPRRSGGGSGSTPPGWPSTRWPRSSGVGTGGPTRW